MRCLGCSPQGVASNELLPHPLSRGMSCHVQVNELPPATRDEQEHIQGLEGHGLDREEVSCPDMGRVVPEEGPPRLRGGTAPGIWTVAANRFGADLEAQLSEFTYDAHASPARVLPRQPSDQFSHLPWQGRSSGVPTTPAPPTPVPSPGCPLPADYSLRLHEDEGAPPTRPAAGEPRPEQAISCPQPRPARLATEDGQLLPEGEVLKEEMVTGAKSVAQERAEEKEIADQGRTP